MATTGEKLVELSDLSTGTALEHLLAITTGGGGTGETVYVNGVLGTVAGAVRATVLDNTIRARVHDDQDAELAGGKLRVIIHDSIDGKVN